NSSKRLHKAGLNKKISETLAIELKRNIRASTKQLASKSDIKLIRKDIETIYSKLTNAQQVTDQKFISLEEKIDNRFNSSEEKTDYRFNSFEEKIDQRFFLTDQKITSLEEK